MRQHFLNQLVKLLNKMLLRFIQIFCLRKENRMGQIKKWNKSATQNGSVRTIMPTKAANICKAVQISIPIGDLTSSLRDIKKIHQWHKVHISRNTKAASLSVCFSILVYYYCKKKINNKNNSQIIFIVHFILKNPVMSCFSAGTQSILGF